MTEPNFVFENEFTLPVLPEAVFAAWTDPAALHAWFAEHVEVDLREGGLFRFWGKHTLGTPADGDANQRVLAVVADRRLEFSWTVLGVPSRVAIEFREGEYTPWLCGAAEDAPPPKSVPGCKMKVRHALEAALTGFERPEHLIEDHWRLAVGNLMSYVEGKPGGIVLPDYAADTGVVELSIEIDAPIETVFRALTEPDQLNKYFAKKARVELKPGGAFDLGWSSSPDAKICRVIEVDPPRRLTISWPDWRGTPDVPDQRVHWMLDAIDENRTRVELRHDGFVRVADRSDYQQGWPGFLEGLRSVAEAARRG